MRLPGRIAILCSLALLGWIGADGDHWAGSYSFTGQKRGADYYNLLVDGLLEGHLYLKADFSPELSSPDPAIRARAPFLLDASAYQAHYYLYFGVVPAVTIFLPYAWLTGHDLSENAVVLAMVVAGFLLSLRIYVLARRRYFEGGPAWWDAVAVILLAFGPMTPVLVMDAGFYEVAIAGGYLWIMAFLFGLYCTLHTRSHATRWLAFASLAGGLAVGCRPTCLLALPALLGVVVFRWRESAAAGANPAESRHKGARLLAAAIIPAAIVGALLMGYNYGRFDDPFEFGFKYQMSPLISTGMPQAKVAFIPTNAVWYYLTPPSLGIYFPYVFPIDAAARPADYYGFEPIHGQWLVLVLALLCAVGVLGFSRRSDGTTSPLRWFTSLALGVFLVLFLCLCTFGFRADRYIVDFQGSLIVGLTLVGTHLAAGRPWVRGAFAGLAGSIALFNVLVSIQLLDHLANTRPVTYAWLQRLGDCPAGFLDRLGLIRSGPLRFKVTFPRPDRAMRVPLVATGTPGHKDVLFVGLHPTQLMELSVWHEGSSGIAHSALLPVEWNRPYEVELDLGSLYPPLSLRDSPAWGDADPRLLKTLVRVTLDGIEVLRTRQPSYDSPPNWLHFGRAPGRAEPPFAGRIWDIQRLPPRNARQLASMIETGVWHIEIELPAAETFPAQPLLSSGRTGHGNLLFLEPAGDGQLRFGLDCWGLGASFSPAFRRPPGPAHRLEIFVGAQAARYLTGRDPGRPDRAALAVAAPILCVWLDGHPLWTTRLSAYADTYDFVGLGSNPQGFSSAQGSYAGRLTFQQLTAEEFEAAVARNLRHLSSTAP